MIVRVLFTILIFTSAFIESTVLPFPFVLLFCSIFFIFFGGITPLINVLLGGLFLDSFLLNHLGFTPIFLYSFFLFVLVLEHVLSYKNSFIVGIVLISGVLFYAYLSSYPFIPSIFILFIFSVLSYVIYENKI